MNRSAVSGHLSMFVANVAWGLMSPLAKIVMVGGIVTPFVLTELRIFGAMVLFWAVSFFGRYEHVALRDKVRLFVASLLAIVFNQGSFIFGVGMSSPADASIIATSMPLWAMILAAFILKEPITGKKVAGIAFGAGGALLLILGSNQGGAAPEGDNRMLGNLLVLTAQLSYAFYLVFFKNFVSRYSVVTIMKWMFTYAFVCTLPFSYRSLIATQWHELGLQVFGAIGFIVVCATFMCYMLVVVGQKYLRPTVAGMYNYIQPLIACVVSVCLGMDSFNVMKSLAVVMIFGGVYLVSVSKSKAMLDKEAENLTGGKR